MKVTSGLIAVLLVFVVGLAGLNHRRLVAVLFNDDLMACPCGNHEVEFRPSLGPAESTCRHYEATCPKCGEKWAVVDVAWDDPRKVIDATLHSMATETGQYADE